jgi:hypothetical protein
MLDIACPRCGSKNIRSSLSRSLSERIRKLLGFFQLRCKDCDLRFGKQIWDPKNAFYAKCPRCYRMDLSAWTTRYYHAPTRWLIYLKLGAKTHRCEYCRHNFVSFRPAKMKFAGKGKVAEGSA